MSLEQPGRGRRFRRLGFAVGGVLLVLVGAVVVTRAASRPAPPSPNVLVIMTDDQTFEELWVMANVKKLAEQGTSFSHYYVSTPNCCPSRATYYSGRFPHNTKVQDNVPPKGGAAKFIPDQAASLGPWMQQAGYYTAHVGKYLNGWGDEYYPGGITPPPGWSRWFGLIDPTTYSYFDYKVSVDGQERSYGKAPEDYQTDVLGAEVVRTIDEAGRSGQPWFVSFTPLAPHIGASETDIASGKPLGPVTAQPAPRHRDVYASEHVPEVPSQAWGKEAADNADLSAKPDYMRKRVRNQPTTKLEQTRVYQREIESLLAVDEWVGHIYDKLAETGQLDRTVIIFASDNGLFHGEHGLLQKNALYEEAVHVPLIVRGPGFPAGRTADQPVENVDLAPTILAAAGVAPVEPLDGQAIQPLANDPSAGTNRELLLEDWYTYTSMSTMGIRAGNWSYLEWSDGTRELYDRAADPYEMTNLANRPERAADIRRLHDDLDKLKSCKGTNCLATWSGG